MAIQRRMASRICSRVAFSVPSNPADHLIVLAGAMRLGVLDNVAVEQDDAVAQRRRQGHGEEVVGHGAFSDRLDPASTPVGG
jgi:hypothetical protein